MGQVEKLKQLWRFPSLMLFWKPKVHPFNKKITRADQEAWERDLLVIKGRDSQKKVLGLVLDVL